MRYGSHRPFNRYRSGISWSDALDVRSVFALPGAVHAALPDPDRDCAVAAEKQEGGCTRSASLPQLCLRAPALFRQARSTDRSNSARHADKPECLQREYRTGAQSHSKCRPRLAAFGRDHANVGKRTGGAGYRLSPPRREATGGLLRHHVAEQISIGAWQNYRNRHGERTDDYCRCPSFTRHDFNCRNPPPAASGSELFQPSEQPVG